MATCRSCETPLTFIRSRTGSSIPVETATIRTYHIVAAGVPPLTVVVTTDGDVVRGRSVDVGTPDARTVYGGVSHFATCPEASSFRRRR
jgi:hypothetical protein